MQTCIQTCMQMQQLPTGLARHKASLHANTTTTTCNNACKHATNMHATCKHNNNVQEGLAMHKASLHANMHATCSNNTTTTWKHANIQECVYHSPRHTFDLKTQQQHATTCNNLHACLRNGNATTIVPGTLYFQNYNNFEGPWKGPRNLKTPAIGPLEELMKSCLTTFWPNHVCIRCRFLD